MAPKSELIRFALAGTASAGTMAAAPTTRRRAVIDAAATMPGRGAYVCRAPGGDRPATACMERAGKRGGFARALRCAVTVEHELVELAGR